MQSIELDENGRLKIAVELLDLYLEFEPKRVPDQITKIESMLDEEADPKMLVQFYLLKSTHLKNEGQYQEAGVIVNQALPYARDHDDSLYLLAKAYNTLGSITDDEGNIELSIKYHLKALRYSEKLNDPNLAADIYAGLGRAYMFLSEYKAAKDYYLRAIRLKEESQNFDIQLGEFYQKISNCFDTEEMYDSSLYYLDKSIQLNKKYNHPIRLVTDYNNKAYTLLLMNKLPEAERNVRRAIFLADSLKEEVEAMYPCSTYAEILFAQNRYNEAEKMMERSISVSRKYNDLYLAKYNLDLLYNIHYQIGDYKKALEYFQQKSMVNDSIYNSESRQAIEKLALEYETEKKNKAIELLNKENKIKAIELKKSNQLQIAFFVAALLSLTVLGLLWSRQKNKVKTDQLMKEAMEKSFEKKLSDTELQALRAQMNPHFLFNCLNSINSFIIKNEQEQASEYLSKFSKLIRQVLHNSKSPKITLSNELESLRLYIEMESLRFNGKFEYEINVDPELDVDYLEVPPMILQPYVENSIWHGLMHKKEGIGRLNITIEKQESMLLCTIVDNGIGRKAAKQIKSKSAVKNKSYGMSITRDRLSYINRKFNESAHVEVVDLEDNHDNSMGTKVVLKIMIENT